LLAMHQALEADDLFTEAPAGDTGEPMAEAVPVPATVEPVLPEASLMIAKAVVVLQTTACEASSCTIATRQSQGGWVVPKNLNTKTLEIERRAQSKARANSSIPDSY
jgi:hypothetical protein